MSDYELITDEQKMMLLAICDYTGQDLFSVIAEVGVSAVAIASLANDPEEQERLREGLKLKPELAGRGTRSPAVTGDRATFRKIRNLLLLYVKEEREAANSHIFKTASGFLATRKPLGRKKRSDAIYDYVIREGEEGFTVPMPYVSFLDDDE